jgi:hypothetical protein
MAKITTDFAGTENATTRATRLKAIYDYYYGSGAYVAEGTLSGVRAGINDIAATDFSNKTAFASWLARANYMNDPDNLRVELGAFLSTTKGAYWDYSDSSKVWDDSAGTDPIAVSDTVGLINAYALGTATPLNYSHPSIGPVWETTYAQHNGSQGLSGSTNVHNIFRNVTVGMMAFAFRCDNLSSGRTLISVLNNASTTNRFGVSITTAGAVSAGVGNTADSGASSIVSGSGLITAGVDYTLIVTVDWGTGGAGAVRGYLNNGSDILNGTLGTGGTMADTAAASSNVGVGQVGRVYRWIMADKIPTAAERALIHGVLKGAYN